jgi:hypothetical protein
MGFYSAEAGIATFISDMDMLNAFVVRGVPGNNLGLSPTALEAME